jgi:2'-5' RNA ligase
MALALICPLDISPSDAARIDALRAAHDPQHGRVAAHFTLVFPFEGLSAVELAAHAGAATRARAPIAFRLRAAIAVRDVMSPRSLIFLTPQEGDAEIRGLHAALYGGPMSPFLRADIPYAPHVTVGAFSDHEAAEAVCARIGPVDIAGRLDALDLVSLEGGRIERLSRLLLR